MMAINLNYMLFFLEKHSLQIRLSASSIALVLINFNITLLIPLLIVLKPGNNLIFIYVVAFNRGVILSLM